MSARASAPALLALALPIFLVVAWPGLDNFYWCEDAAWLLRAARFSDSWDELFRIYGRDFNPLFLVFVRIQTALFGTGPAAANVASVVLHATAALFLAGIFERLLGDPKVAAGLAFLWLVSSHTDETLFWSGARGHALAAPLFFAAWAAFESPGRAARLAPLVFLAALLAKETAIVLPAVLFCRRIVLSGAAPGAAWRETKSFWLVAGVYAAARVLMVRADIADVSTGGLALNPAFLLKKFAFLVGGFLEMRFLHWESADTPVVAGVFLLLVALRGGRSGKFAVCWIVLASLPILPIPKHSPRYELLVYPGFLLAAASLLLPLARSRMSAAVALAVATSLFACAQAYLVFLDERDYDMRSRYLETLAAQYEEAASSLPDGAVFTVRPSSWDRQPEINARTRIAKLNAPIPGGIWGIIAAEDLVGMVEYGRGRVVDAVAAPPSDRALVLLHADTGFAIADSSVAGEAPFLSTRPIRAR